MTPGGGASDVVRQRYKLIVRPGQPQPADSRAPTRCPVRPEMIFQPLPGSVARDLLSVTTVTLATRLLYLSPLHRHLRSLPLVADPALMTSPLWSRPRSGPVSQHRHHRLSQSGLASITLWCRSRPFLR